MNITLDKKTSRVIDKKIKVLFFDESFSSNDSLHGDFFSYLNRLGKARLEKIGEIFWAGFDEKESILLKNFDDLFRKSFLAYIDKDRIPSYEELKNSLLDALSGEITQKNHIFKVFGVDFKDDPPKKFPLMKADEELLKKIEYDGDSGNLKIGDPILVITSFGDMDKAIEKSIYKANLILAILSVLICSNFKEAGRKFKMSVVSPTISPEIGVIDGWDEKGALFKITCPSPPIFIDKNIYSIYEEGYDQIVEEVKSESNTEVFRLIKTSLFWFFDAQKSFSAHSSFVQYWTAIETFFSGGDTNKITEKNKKGLSCLVHASKIFPDDLESLMKDAVALYDKRSRALHDGNYEDITNSDVDKVSIYAAISILGVIFLYKEGKVQSREDIIRLTNKYHAKY